MVHIKKKKILKKISIIERMKQVNKIKMENYRTGRS